MAVRFSTSDRAVTMRTLLIIDWDVEVEKILERFGSNVSYGNHLRLIKKYKTLGLRLTPELKKVIATMMVSGVRAIHGYAGAEGAFEGAAQDLEHYFSTISKAEWIGLLTLKNI